jgi:E1A/CREB-binding protein
MTGSLTVCPVRSTGDRELPKSLPYKGKGIMLFQKIDGVDLCLFSMYVQEYDHTCPEPNSRRVYIAYLDSVEYFRPRTARTKVNKLYLMHVLKGDHASNSPIMHPIIHGVNLEGIFMQVQNLRIPRLIAHQVYHEILVSYLLWCRLRGFRMAHIWACPPSRGNNFIFWCHPQHQKTPSKDRLLEWYVSMPDMIK